MCKKEKWEKGKMGMSVKSRRGRFPFFPFSLFSSLHTLQCKTNALSLTCPFLLLVLAPLCASAQAPQNPSPMVEHTREHRRLERSEPAGRRIDLEVGNLFIPDALTDRKRLPLFVHFHGGTWLPEVTASKVGRAAVVSVQLGSGSGVYARAFSDPESFRKLLDEVEAKAGVRFEPVGLTAWSAGYGAIRAILAVPQNYRRTRFIILLDGLHASYADDPPDRQNPRLAAERLDVFLRFARDATLGRKQMILTHTEVFPGTYASTTETADYLLEQLELRRTPVLKWGPVGTQQLSEVSQGQFLLKGYAGNSAPDHVDQLHALPEHLKCIEWEAR